MTKPKLKRMTSLLLWPLFVGPAVLHGQGLVDFVNGPATLVRTNSLGLGGTAGITSPGTNAFAYGLFIAPSTITSLSPTDLLTPPWTFTGVYATNWRTLGGALQGGANTPVPGWDNVTNSYVVAGWSANIAWTSWGAVAAQLAGASFTNGVWSGANWDPSSQGGFFGVSAIGYGLAPDPIRGRPGFPLFGDPNIEGVPLATGWDLFVVNTPEPSIFALAASALLATLLLRRRWHDAHSAAIASSRSWRAGRVGR
jgi:hypothetical protein